MLFKTKNKKIQIFANQEGVGGICSSSGTGCSRVDSPQCHKSCQQTSPWIHRTWQRLAPAWSFHRITASPGHSSSPAWGPPCAAGGSLLLLSPWLQGHCCLSLVCTMGCRGLSVLRAPSDPASELGACRAVFVTYSYFCLLWLQLQCVKVLLPSPHLYSVIPEVLPAFLECSDLDGAGAIFGAGWHYWLCLTQGRFLAVSHTSSPCSPIWFQTLTKTQHKDSASGNQCGSHLTHISSNTQAFSTTL